MAVLNVLYCASLIYAYIAYLSPLYGYMGFPAYSASHSGGALMLGLCFAVGVSLLLPPVIRTYSAFVLWVVYYFLLVPILIIVPMQGYEPDGGVNLVTNITASFMAAYMISEWVTHYSGISRPGQGGDMPLSGHSSPRFVVLLLASAGATFLLLGWVYRSHVEFIGFVDFSYIYDYRLKAAQIASGAGIEYLQAWATFVLAPLLVAIGLLERRQGLAGLGIIGLLFLYLAGGYKFLLAGILLLVVVRVACFTGRRVHAEHLGMIILGGIVAPLGLFLLFGELMNVRLFDNIVSQALMRLYGTPGMITGVYAEFFRSNPYTYYSHIGPISWITNYPYDVSLGRVIGWYRAHSLDYNASANFWATDGIAALGAWGILICGVALGVLLALANVLIKPCNLRLVCLASLITVWQLCDVGIAQSLITGGWIFHVMIGIYRRPVVSADVAVRDRHD